MSTDWALHCAPCDVQSPSIDRGQPVFVDVLEVWPQIRAILDAKALYIEVGIMAHHDIETDLFDFLREHFTHQLEFISEYGQSEPLWRRP